LRNETDAFLQHGLLIRLFDLRLYTDTVC